MLEALQPGYYVATHKDHRPQIVEYCSGPSCAPHWRNHLDDRMRFDPRDLGFELRPLDTKAPRA